MAEVKDVAIDAAGYYCRKHLLLPNEPSGDGDCPSRALLLGASVRTSLCFSTRRIFIPTSRANEIEDVPTGFKLPISSAGPNNACRKLEVPTEFGLFRPTVPELAGDAGGLLVN